MDLVVHQAKMSFISGKSGGVSHLRAHLSYVSREQALYFAYNATAQTFNKLFNFAHEKLKRRKDARIALRMHIALPYLWYVVSKRHPDYLELKAKELTRFIANALQLNQEDIMLFFHKPEEDGRNFHVHVVSIAQTKDGKPLKLSPTMLKAFHQKLDEFLAEQGFEVFRYRDFPELQLSRSQIRALSLPTGVYKREEIATVVAEKRRAIRMYAEGELNKRNKQVYDFCKMLYDKNDVVWLMLRNGRTGEVEHRRKRIIEINDRFLAWLRHKNANGFDVYITLNSFRADSQRRTEQEIEPKQDKIWLDLDSEKLKRDGLEVLKQIMQELKLPPPTTLVRTSETSYGRNYQAVWKFNQKVDFGRLKRVMQELEKRYGLDATHDGARVFRVPGYNNKKQGKVGRDLCSLVEVGKVYDISLLEELERRLSHAEASQRLAEKEKKEEKRELGQQLAGKQATTQQLQQQKKVGMARYAEYLMNYARQRLQLEINLENVSEDKSESELDFAFCREVLRHLLLRIGMPTIQAIEEVEGILQSFLNEVRPAKLMRSKDYAKITARKAYLSLARDRGVSYREALEAYAWMRLNIRLRIKPSRPNPTEHELNFLFSRGVLRYLLEAKQVPADEAVEVATGILSDFLAVVRPDELEEDKDYPKLVVEQAFQSIENRASQQEEQEKREKNNRQEANEDNEPPFLSPVP